MRKYKQLEKLLVSRKGRRNMELACTKKLLEYVGIKAEKMTDDIDPLFVWTANLMVVNRRKTIVVTHAASRCSFVLHGLKVKDLPRLPELILSGIRSLLESEYVRPEIIDQYLKDLGRGVTFRANSSRKVVASCNKACELVMWLSDLLEPESLLQQNIMWSLNDDILPGGNYLMAYEVLIGQLKARYGENVRVCRALELEVKLELHSPCKRRILVPDNLNFYQLHNILQNCFAWKNYHLHQFVVEVDADGYPAKVIHPEWNELEELPRVQVQNSVDVTLWEVFALRKKIVYEYDFGDGWSHIVELCRVIEDCPEPYPRCILAVGDAPMEDCGGPDGFAYVQKVLKDPSHQEHREISEWVHSTWWRPLDVERINCLVKNAHRKRAPVFW